MNVVPVIMAGGAGTRLWPLSRDEKPKQFHNLSGEGTLLEGTIRRLLPIKPEELIIVSSRKYESLSQMELAKFEIPGTILSEPRPRNTAAAILYAALYIKKAIGDAVMIVLPADHFIKNTDEFARILEAGVNEAEEDKLVTIGIKPTYPETGYGYIKVIDGSSDLSREIDRFVEKPDIERARQYVDAGDYFWNSGIFLWKATAILKQFTELMPGHLGAFKAFEKMSAEEIASNDDKHWKIKEEIFSNLESVSIDYGILEKAGNRFVIPGDFGWLDLGSWKSIDDVLTPDEMGNRAPDKDSAIFLNTKNSSVFTENCRVSIIGLNNVTVVQAGSEILVIDKDSSQDVKKVAEMIKVKG